MSNHITLERLNKVLAYDPETGFFTRLACTWPGAVMGERLGSLRTDGYLQFAIDGRRYKLHRLAWFISTGEWPRYEIDHINGNRSDNRLANLRDVTPSMNQHNRAAVRGVTKTGTPDKPWRAQIKVPGGKRLYLGIYATEAEARSAYVEAKLRLHPGAIEVNLK